MKGHGKALKNENDVKACFSFPKIIPKNTQIYPCIHTNLLSYITSTMFHYIGSGQFCTQGPTKVGFRHINKYQSYVISVQQIPVRVRNEDMLNFIFLLETLLSDVADFTESSRWLRLNRYSRGIGHQS